MKTRLFLLLIRLFRVCYILESDSEIHPPAKRAFSTHSCELNERTRITGVLPLSHPKCKAENSSPASERDGERRENQQRNTWRAKRNAVYVEFIVVLEKTNNTTTSHTVLLLLISHDRVHSSSPPLQGLNEGKVTEIVAKALHRSKAPSPALEPRRVSERATWKTRAPQYC